MCNEKETVTNIIIPDSSHINTIKDTRLVNALIFVESRGKDNAESKVSNAAGCLQILPIMVKEVNNILKRIGSDMRYTLDDRYDRKKSIEIFKIWRYYHHMNDSQEIIARNWNGGPNGYLLPSTMGYWNKVKKRL